MQSKQSSKHNPLSQDRTDSQYPPVNLYPGQHLHGFEIKAVTPIDELRAVAIETRASAKRRTAATSLYRRRQTLVFDQSDNSNA